MFGYLLQQLKPQSQTAKLKKYLLKQHKQYLKELIHEARIFGVLTRPCLDEDIQPYYQTIHTRYQGLLSYVHETTNAKALICLLRTLVNQMKQEITPKKLRQLRQEFLLHFKYLETVRKSEQTIQGMYIVALDTFMKKNLAIRNDSQVPYGFYCVPPSLAVLMK